MKTSDISDTPLVRKYGVRGAKLYVRLWFPFMYGSLIALTTAFWAVAPEFAVGWGRIFMSGMVGGITVLAASLLTRMRLEFLSAVELLETGGRTPGGSTR